MPKKVHHGAMFVFPNVERKGSFVAKIPTVWDEDQVITKYFGTANYDYPKLAALRFVDKYLNYYYGKDRAEYISSIPQFVKRMKFGCQVGITETQTSRRGVKYPCVIVGWSEYEGAKRRRKQKVFLYNAENRIPKLHEASLFAAKKRSEQTMSNLDNSALNFEYDLNF